MNDPLLTITVYQHRPGMGTNWLVEARQPNGSLALNAQGPRDAVVAALAELVEELHQIPDWPERRQLWL